MLNHNTDSIRIRISVYYNVSINIISNQQGFIKRLNNFRIWYIKSYIFKRTA